MWLRLVILTFLTYLIAGCSEVVVIEPYPTQTSRIIFTNGKINTLNEETPLASAMVIEQGKIIFVGDNVSANTYSNSEAKVIDLKGKFVFPGLVDSHTHPGLVAILGEDSDDGNSPVLPVSSKADLFKYLEQYASDNWYQPFILLGSWDVLTFLPNGPAKEELDKIFPYRPVLLMDNSGHSFWANSSALWLLGVDENTPDLSENISYFVRNENGEPTGWIKEYALFPSLGDLLVPSDEVLENKLLTFLTELRNQGITTLWDAGNFDWDDAIYNVLSKLDKSGKLPLHYEGSYHIWQPDQLATAVSSLKELREKYSGERLKFNTLKIHYDGVSEIQTAGMLEPYVETNNNRGGILFSAEVLADFMLELNREKLHLHLHSVGDRSTQEILDAVELATEKNKKPLAIKITLSHLETVSNKDIARFNKFGVFANFTPHWFSGAAFGSAGVYNLGKERASRSQEIHKFANQNAQITLSSDVVSESEKYRANPFIGIQMSVTRKEYDSTGPFKISPTQGITVQEAIKAYTINGAKQLGLEKDIGSLSIGKKANFIILENNLIEQKTEEIHKTVPYSVYVEGISNNEH